MNESIKLGDGYWAFKENALLAYNDENNNFKPIDLNSTRASSATRVNKLGLIESVNTGVPRVDYLNNPKGSLLVEPQSTNLALRSEEFDNASWVKNGVTVTPNTLTSPKGDLTADTISNSLVSDFISQIYTGTTGTTYTYSIFIQNNNAVSTSFLVRNTLNALGGTINWSGKTITSVSSVTGGTLTFEYYGNDWYRIIGTFVSVEDNIRPRISPDITVGSKSLFLWGAQLELGSNATSYIPTVASTVTRVADVISKTGISSLIGQTEGTVFIDTKYSSGPVTASGRWFNVFDTTNNIGLALNAANSVRTIINGASDTITTSPKTNLGVKIAFAYNSLGVVLFINGVQYALPNGGSQIITSLNSIVFDPLANSQLQTVDINLLALWKERLSNETLAQLTTL